MDITSVQLGFALTGSFCTLKTAIDSLRKMKEQGYNILPIMSESVFFTDTRFGKCKDFIDEVEFVNK